jgi:biotin carboxylase
MSPIERPLLVLVASGDRRYREYILAAVATEYRIWLLDREEPSWHRPYLTGWTVVDTTDPAALVKATLDIPAGRGSPDGLLCYDEWTIEATAAAANELGLPSSPATAIACCRDKAATRRLAAAAGLPQPESVPVGDRDTAVEVATRLGYPVVVKARALAGSIAVVRADDAGGVAEAYDRAAGTHFPLAPAFADGVLVEEYVDGPEISVDSAVRDGVAQPIAVAHKRTGLAPWFEETSHVVDSHDPLLTDPGFRDLLQRTHDALGLTQGMTHAEYRHGPHGWTLIEMNARLGGDFIPLLGRLATGVDLALTAADVATGRLEPRPPNPAGAAGIVFGYPSRPGTISRISVREPPWPPYVQAVVATSRSGDGLGRPPEAFMSRYGYVIAQAPGAAQVRTALATALDLIDLQLADREETPPKT